MDDVLSLHDQRRTRTWAVDGWGSCSVFRICSRQAAHRRGMPTLAIESVQLTEIGAAETHRPFEHRIEHRGEVAGRTVDDLQNLGHGRLSRQCLIKLGSAFGKLAGEISNGPSANC
jgi:hypothetical protein